MSLLWGGCWVDWTRDTESPPSTSCVDVQDGEPPAFQNLRVLENPASTHTDDHPSVSHDLLQLFFRSNTGPQLGGGAVFYSTRSSPELPFGPAQVVTELDDAARDRGPEISGDARTIYWATDRRAGFLEIWVARRDDPTAEWTDARPAPGLEDISATAPSVTQDGLTMVLQSKELEPNLGNDDLYIVRKDPMTGRWGSPEWLENVNSDVHDGAPFLSDDGLLLYFEREDPDAGRLRDIYRAVRSDTDDPFGVPEPVTEINSEAEEETPFLTADCKQLFLGCELGGNPDLCAADRP